MPRIALGALAVGFALSAGISACNKETAAVAEPADPARSTASTPKEDSAGSEVQKVAALEKEAAPAAARVDEPNFALALKPSGPYQAGQAGELSVVLEAKGDYKVNDKYPFKFKLKPSDGVQFPSDVVKQDAVKLEPKQAVMTVPFTPQTAGDKRIAGQFSFSVCTEERCLIEKRDLDVTVQVK